jgi:hypothetical protein
MKNISRILSIAFAIAAVTTISVSAQEKAAKKSPATTIVTQFLKNLEKAELSAEQLAKAKELFTKAATEVAAKRTEAGITAEILKKRNDAGKAAKEAGKKGKELQAAIDSGSEMTESQKKLFVETEAILSKARIEVGKLLSAEQLAKLPALVQTTLKPREEKKAK